MTESTARREGDRRRTLLSSVAALSAGAAFMGSRAEAEGSAAADGVPAGYSAASGVPGFAAATVTESGAVEVMLSDGRIVTFDKSAVQVVDGVVYITDAALYDEGLFQEPGMSGAEGAPAGGGAGVLLGVLGGAVALGAAAGGGGGGGSSNAPAPAPTPPPNNNPPQFTSSGQTDAAENSTGTVYSATATDADGNSITYSLVGGSDSSLFTISNSGALQFNSGPDFESPGDSDGDNVYEVIIRASDGTNTTDQTVLVTVTDVDEAPVFEDLDPAFTTENTTAVLTAVAVDPEGADVTYSISGTDAALFTIDAATGEVRFIAAPDYESPADSDLDGSYQFTVTASDGNQTSSAAYSVDVLNVNDNAPVITSVPSINVSEGRLGVYQAAAVDLDGDSLSYSLSGTDAALFTIDSTTGEVSFVTASDFEDPADSDGDNAYEVVVSVTDGDFTDDLAVTINVFDAAETGAPVFVSGSSSSVSENQTSAYVARADDAEGDAVIYSISGTDAGLFSVNAQTGEVRFNAAPNFESPGDADANGVYEITVTASDGTTSGTQDVSIQVTDAVEGSDLPADNSTTISMVSGGSYVGNLETSGDQDWVRIELEAGQRYQFDLTGTGADPLDDPYVRLYDQDGNLLAENDDISLGVVVDSSLGFTAQYSGVYYVSAGAYQSDTQPGTTGQYTLAVAHTDPLREWTFQEIADYLDSNGWDGAQFDASTGDVLTVDISTLTTAGQTLARGALDLWAGVTGLVFQEVSSGATIVFSDDEEGAFAGPSGISGGFFTGATVNVGTDWLDTYGTGFDSYSFQTYIHEVGHALGLGHAGPYNGSADYGVDAIYLNDSWQVSVMSYFSQNENTHLDASFAYVIGLQITDILAAHDMYGTSTTTRSGDTTYGFNTNAGTLFDATAFSNPVTFAIFDSGGIDTLDYSGEASAQILDLRAGAFSSTLGLTNNLGIALGTVIENAIGGSGQDVLVGNAADNRLTGNAGNDTFYASAGSDIYEGGAGSDRAVFSGPESDYTVTTNGAGNTVVTDNRAGSPDGVTELIGIETIEYDGQSTAPGFFGDDVGTISLASLDRDGKAVSDPGVLERPDDMITPDQPAPVTLKILAARNSEGWDEPEPGFQRLTLDDAEDMRPAAMRPYDPDKLQVQDVDLDDLDASGLASLTVDDVNDPVALAGLPAHRPLPAAVDPGILDAGEGEPVSPPGAAEEGWL